ncbi:hypothetical protein H8N00_20030 [Streptomyces sp. AC563]|uniref:hypothetical protein n=1 Tax=Streptomyces buecherae TaxID=2763006 RepID=UPI00164D241B|nr:hypothetical protein [Streptomyces buecherae]MBC3991118.1 hypothetical protein [Streptomyces buecherae]
MSIRRVWHRNPSLGRGVGGFLALALALAPAPDRHRADEPAAEDRRGGWAPSA